jgi:hypothetical protein
MRTISTALKAKLNSGDYSGLGHKLLLYRRKWNVATSKYELENTPVDISDAINGKGTRASITQQLDNEIINEWRVGNLALTLYNKNNRFWEGKEDGLFPVNYTLYGSKIEYYFGDVASGNYVKCFTGYLTDVATFRQDNALIDFQVLNRLDFLKTVSAEGVSTSVNNAATTSVSNRERRTTQTGVGRILRVLQGQTLATAVEIIEYRVSDLNNAYLGALITLSSDLLPGEAIWVDLIYWRKGIMIDVLVRELLTEAGITDFSKVEPVVFQNNVRVYLPAFENTVAWYYSKIDNYTMRHSGDSNTFNSMKFRSGGSSEGQTISIVSGQSGSFRFHSDTYQLESPYGTSADIHFEDSVGRNGISFYFTLANLKQITIQLQRNGNATTIYEGTFGGTAFDWVLSYNQNTIKIFRDGIELVSVSNTDPRNYNLIDGGVARYANGEFSNLAFVPEYMSSYSQYGSVFTQDKMFGSNPKINFQVQNTSSDWISWINMFAATSISGSPKPILKVRSRNSLTDPWGEYLTIQIGDQIGNLGKYLDFLFINNVLSNGNKYNFSNAVVWYFLVQNVPLGVCNLTNMSVLQALQELALMSMYEIGFDTDDIFFFRPREKTTYIKELTDKQIIRMPTVKENLDRLKTQVAVTYGEFNKIVNCNTQNEPEPTNKQKYGERLFELSGSQLLPADNVDLTYAVAITIYAELSKLRLGLSVTTKIDLELELSDYVRILHNNNLWLKGEFTDWTKWKELGTFYMRSKVIGIRTDFMAMTTELTLLDYTAETDYPNAEGEDFMYEIPNSFDLKQ